MMKAVKVGVHVAIVACVVLITVYYYNLYETCLVKLDQDKALWDNEIQRRASLLPNMILVSAEYSAHEKALVEYVTEMRRYLGKQGGERPSDTADSPASRLMTSLLAVSEQYPDLKATQSFELLMHGLADTSNRITDARITYIRAIKDLNDLYTQFPSNVFGRLFFVKNREQWKNDTFGASDADLERAVRTFLVARTETKPPRAVEPGHVGRELFPTYPRPSDPDARKPASPERPPE